MISYREILRLHSQGFSQRSISASCNCGKGTVQRALAHAKEHGLEWPLPSDMTDERIKKLFSAAEGNGEAESTVGTHMKPDFEKIHREMAKKGVTLSLLWNEYCAECRSAGGVPCMYTAFCTHYRAHSQRSKVTMRLERRPGEQLEVDWAGQTMAVSDNITGAAIPVYVFVSALSYSGYAYVEGFLSRNQESWIMAHVNAYQYFGGSTRILVPDNLKTGVTRVDAYEPVINRSYQEMAEHYQTAILPARVRKPKDKPGVEGTVGVISTWIIAALRNRKFFSLLPLKEPETRDLLEIVEARHQKGSTLFLSQFPPAGWHSRIGEGTLADAILDRIVHDSYEIFIDGKDSMRKRKGLKK